MCKVNSVRIARGFAIGKRSKIEKEIVEIRITSEMEPLALVPPLRETFM